ncbi:MAG: 6-carboxytetrahydropterin synthase, partial [Fimbriimonas sp.]|nr:6-carboxytetrahydropterin synthase [Fimbriimonas sp.]
MTRRVGFSSGHRYWIPSLSDVENRRLFGKWASPYNHGHNYVLDVTVQGFVDPHTGMVVNIKRIDDVLRGTIVSEFDGKSINDEVGHFHSISSTLENLMAYFADRLRAPGVLPSEVYLTGLRLEEMPGFYGELHLTESTPMMTLTRSYEFAAAHRLDSPFLTPDENLELFGKCNNPAGHGHNYILEVTVSGDPDPATGMLADLALIDRVVNEEVVDRYDHKNLNMDLPEFQGRPTSSEIVTLEIFGRLNGRLPAKLERVRLFETARNMFEVS